VARNKGVDLAKAEWVSFLDSDDYWEPCKLSEVSKVISQPEKNLVLVSHWENIINSEGDVKLLKNSVTGDIDLYSRLLFEGNFFYSCRSNSAPNNRKDFTSSRIQSGN